MKVKKRAIIPKNQCVACGVCVKVCPRNAISIISGVYAKVDDSLCVGCGLCAKACPASIIKMEGDVQ
ncbi:UNVERIFIED_CONTAM: 4Fe-4S dicluster protein [Acetivibrio alkalicellulosi]